MWWVLLRRLSVQATGSGTLLRAWEAASSRTWRICRRKTSNTSPRETKHLWLCNQKGPVTGLNIQDSVSTCSAQRLRVTWFLSRVVGALNVWAYTAFFREATSKRSAPLGSAIFAFVLFLVLACRTMTDIMITLWTKNSGEEGARGDAAWIRDCAILMVVLILIQCVRVVVHSSIVTAISLRTHGGMLKSVLGASVPLFFDVVPTGRVLNRFSKGPFSLDTQLSDWMAQFFQLGAAGKHVCSACWCPQNTERIKQNLFFS